MARPRMVGRRAAARLRHALDDPDCRCRRVRPARVAHGNRGARSSAVLVAGRDAYRLPGRRRDRAKGLHDRRQRCAPQRRRAPRVLACMVAGRHDDCLSRVRRDSVRLARRLARPPSLAGRLWPHRRRRGAGLVSGRTQLAIGTSYATYADDADGSDLAKVGPPPYNVAQPSVRAAWLRPAWRPKTPR